MLSERAALLVRLAPELKTRLVDLAKRERRSLSRQVEVLLEEALQRMAKAELTDLEVHPPKRGGRRNSTFGGS